MEQAAELAAPYVDDQRAVAIERRTSSLNEIWIYDRSAHRWLVQD
jgi:hypothetical protein